MNIWIFNHYIGKEIGELNGRHRYFSKFLQEKGHCVSLFYSSVKHGKDIDVLEKEKCKYKIVRSQTENNIIIKTRRYLGNGKNRVLNMYDFYRGLIKNYKHFVSEIGKPDIIIASSVHPLTCVAGEKIAKKLKVPCIVEIRDLWPLSIVEYSNLKNDNPIVKLMYRFEKKIYKKADALIFTMPGGKDYIQEKGWQNSVDLYKVFSINNGVDTNLQDYQRKTFVIEDEDLSDSSFKVIYAGAMREVNNLNSLLDVAKEVANKGYKEIRFLFYGDGGEREKLEKRCSDEQITNVVFKGRVDKKYIPYICSKAGLNIINVKPTKISDYGVSWNKLFDYMNAGRPIVSNLKVKYDWIDKYQCGISCDDQNPKTVANAVIEIFNLSKDEYDKLCVNAKKAAEEFDFAVLTDKLQEVIEYAINKNERK